MKVSVDSSIMTKTTQRVVLPAWWTTSNVGGVGETVGIFEAVKFHGRDEKLQLRW